MLLLCAYGLLWTAVAVTLPPRETTGPDASGISTVTEYTRERDGSVKKHTRRIKIATKTVYAPAAAVARRVSSLLAVSGGPHPKPTTSNRAAPLSVIIMCMCVGERGQPSREDDLYPCWFSAGSDAAIWTGCHGDQQQCHIV